MAKKLLPLITLLLASPTCQESDSTLLVNLACDPDAAPSQFIQVDLSEPNHLNDTKTFQSVPAGQPMQFPTSLVLVIPRSHSGRLDLAFQALDANYMATAHATVRVTLVAGTQTTTNVRLIAGSDLCGNGIVDPGEGCDDSNLYSFDGCDYQCHLESPSSALPPDAGSADASNPDTLTNPSPDLSLPPPDTGMTDTPRDDTANRPDATSDLSPDILPPLPDAGADTSTRTDTSPDLSPDILPPLQDAGTDANSCLQRFRANGYSMPTELRVRDAGVPSCNSCAENGVSYETQCKKTIDCLLPSWPSCAMGSACWNACIDNAGFGTRDLAEICVKPLVVAACGSH